ncbi:MAG: glycosyltransferase family 2 protein [Armatimonadetes bacterium]|nr:glycosyltransferase family 2 protein [Armatimonadota bacterium]
MKLSVIIPVYNERDTIEETLRRVQAAPVDKEVIIVDDCSTDGTREWLRQSRAEGIAVFYHPENRGKGSAIRTALGHVTGDIVIIQDADLEYRPDEYPLIMQPFIEGKADVVYGSRFLNGRPRMKLPNFIINKLLAWLANVLFRSRLTDEATCYKAFRKEVIAAVPLTCKRFEFCPEVTAKLLRSGHQIVEVSISYCPRTVQEGKKINWKDGVVALWTLIKYRFVK